MKYKKIKKIKRATTIMEDLHYKKMLSLLKGEGVAFSYFSNNLLEDLILFRDSSNEHNEPIFKNLFNLSIIIGIKYSELLQFLIMFGVLKILEEKGDEYENLQKITMDVFDKCLNSPDLIDKIKLIINSGSIDTDQSTVLYS